MRGKRTMLKFISEEDLRGKLEKRGNTGRKRRPQVVLSEVEGKTKSHQLNIRREGGAEIERGKKLNDARPHHVQQSTI